MSAYLSSSILASPAQTLVKTVSGVAAFDLKYNILTDIKVISEPELKSLKGKRNYSGCQVHGSQSGASSSYWFMFIVF